jgi:hypothetical protein
MIINYIPGTFSDPCNNPITPIFHHDGLSHGTESRIRTNYAPPGLTIPVVIRSRHVLTMELFSFMSEPTRLFRGKLLRARQDDFQALEYVSCKIGFSSGNSVSAVVRNVGAMINVSVVRHV